MFIFRSVFGIRFGFSEGSAIWAKLYCVEAKAILGRLDAPFTEISLDDDPRSGMLMSTVTGEHTVPQIFFHETHIGGASDLKALDESRLRSEVASALDQSGRPWFLDKPPTSARRRCAALPEPARRLPPA